MGQKAILTFENPGDGTINVKLEFDPPINGESTDPVAHYALAAMQVLARESEESDDSDD